MINNEEIGHFLKYFEDDFRAYSDLMGYFSDDSKKLLIKVILNLVKKNNLCNLKIKLGFDEIIVTVKNKEVYTRLDAFNFNTLPIELSSDDYLRFDKGTYHLDSINSIASVSFISLDSLKVQNFLKLLSLLDFGISEDKFSSLCFSEKLFLYYNKNLKGGGSSFAPDCGKKFTNEWRKEVLKLSPSNDQEDSLSDVFSARQTSYQRKENLTRKTVLELFAKVMGKQKDDNLAFPSSGALYPINLYLFVNNISGIESGMYRYCLDGSLSSVEIEKQDFDLLKEAYLRPAFILDNETQLQIYFCADIDRIMGNYDKIVFRLALMNASVMLQNFHLAANYLGFANFIGSVGFYPDTIKKYISKDELYLFDHVYP